MQKTLGTRLLDQEKKVRNVKFSIEAKTILEYLLLLQEDKMNKLIKSTDDRDMHILIGELRSYDKLISIVS